MRTLANTLLLFALMVTGCTSKVSQCNRLIDAINLHATDLANAIESLAEIDTKPEVAAEFASVIENAQSSIEKLEVRDERVATFAVEYGALLAEAKTLGTSLQGARSDDQKREAVIASAAKVVAMEEAIVASVNAYCQAE